MVIEFSSRIWYWRGPAPYYFVTIPEQPSRQLKAVSKFVTYGWGVIPVLARIGETEWQTSLIPKNGGYLLPVKDSVRNVENLEIDDDVTVQLRVNM
ncbi:MAG TPA: DUF1905 domain-containing protein [Anaerolineaceae bacterium]|nr:DUF1905 domain-containing protein [Anaerolineaceae bacterium]